MKNLRKIIVKLLILIVVFGLFLPQNSTYAATYYFTQNDWSGGATTTSAVHPTNQTGWNYYLSKDSTLSATGTLNLIPITSTVTQTSDTDFSAGIFFQTQIVGTGTSAVIQLSPIYSSNTWTPLAPAPAPVGGGGALVFDLNGNIYAFRGGGTTDFWKYSISSNTWIPLAPAPAPVGNGGALVYDGNGHIYAFRGGGTTDFWKYSISSNTWTYLAPAPQAVDQGGALAYDGNGNIYALRGNWTTDFWKYSISSNTWTYLAPAPQSVAAGGALAYDGNGNIYASKGAGASDFWKYSISSNTWTGLVGKVSSWGAALVYDQNGNIYAFRGGGLSDFLKYSISSNTWTPLAPAPAPVAAGGALAYDGNGNIYAFRGGSTDFWKYSIYNMFYGPGTFESGVIDLGGRMTLLTLNFTSSVASGTSLKIQLASSDSSLGPWNYVGPDGTSASYFTTSGQSIPSVLSGKRYLRYKVYFNSNENAWISLPNAPKAVSSGGALTYDLNGNIYAIRGYNSTAFMKYSISSNTWTLPLSAPAQVNWGGALTFDLNGNIYAFRGGGTTDFWKYSISSNTWTSLASTTAPVGAGGALTFDLNGNIYAFRGGGTTDFWKYSISSNTWTSLAPAPAAVDGGGALAYDGNGNIYALRGGGTTDFWKYSISSNTWTLLARAPAIVGPGGALVYDGNGNIYALRGGGTTDFWKYSISSNTWTSLTPLPAGVRDGGALAYDGNGNIYAFSGWGGLAFWKYSKFGSATPQLDSLAVNYSGYLSSSLISSPYDTSDNANIIVGISWDEDVPAGTGIIVSLRTASSSSLLDSSPWFDFTSTTTGCTKNATTVICSSSAIPLSLKDGAGDRFVQYKVTLNSDGINTPTFDNFSLTYVVNAPPEFDNSFGSNGISAFQVPDPQDLLWGRVKIQYSIRDPDTTQGSVTPGYITPRFQYSLDNGNTWNDITSNYLRDGDLANKAVQEVNYTTYDAIWDVKAQIPNVYTNNLLLKVIINDNEGANNLAFRTATLTIDTKKPTININYLKIDASQNQVLAKFNILDDTTTTNKYIISNNADLSYDGLNVLSQDWQNLATTSLEQTFSWQLTGIYPKVYLGVESVDQYGNVASSTISAIAPSSLGNLELKDISRVNLGWYAEFISWNIYQVTTSAEFSKYEIFRSTDSVNYSLIASSTDINNFYFVDSGLDNNLTYYYKVRVVDTDGDISGWSSVVSDKPDGQGGTDFTPPRISNVQVAEVNATWAKIRWQTDELSNSIVDFAIQTATPTWMTASSSAFVYNHEIVLTNLQPGTNYIFQVRSKDIMDNEAIDNNNGNYYSFTTLQGVVISAVTTRYVGDTFAEIIWNTNLPANSYVIYSTDINNLRNNTSTNEVGSAELVTQHIVKLTNLLQRTTYYYYVKSTDQNGNTAIDNNGGNFYSFTTSYDTQPPKIYDVRVPIQTSKLLVISWLTDEPADGQIEYGTQQGVYSSSTEISPYLSTFHALTLSGLSPQTTYYFRIKSKDHMNNLAISQEYTASTTAEEAKLITQTVYLGVSTEQYNQLKADYDKLQQEAQKMKQELERVQDKTPPEISNIEIKNVQPFSATVCFRTNEPAIGIVQYGEEKGKYPYSVSEDDYLTSHCLELTRLKMGTKYYLRIIAIDRSGNRGIKTTK
jgi:outer membrane protein assembly factor BamB